jgi:hypothetical protein
LEDFEEKYFMQQPLIMVNASKNNATLWSKRQMRDRFGDQLVSVGTAGAFGRNGFSIGSILLKDYIDRMDLVNSSSSDLGSNLYVFDKNSIPKAESFSNAFRIHPLFAHHSAGLTFTLGYSGTGMNFHFHMDGWLEV